MQNYEKSLRDANRAMENDPKWEKGYYRAGMALMALERFPEALENFNQAVALAPTNVQFKNEQVRAKAAMLKDMSEAEIIKIDGNDAFKNGRIEEAIEIYTRAVAACKPNEKDMNVKCDCLANRAACYRQLYHPEECIRDCTEVLSMQPNHVKALIRRAQAYESMEKYQKALDDFIQVSRLDPEAKIAYEGVSRLRSSMARMGSGKNWSGAFVDLFSGLFGL